MQSFLPPFNSTALNVSNNVKSHSISGTRPEEIKAATVPLRIARTLPGGPVLTKPNSWTPQRPVNLMKFPVRAVIIFIYLHLLFGGVFPCLAAEVLLAYGSKSGEAESQVEQACTLYGLGLEKLLIDDTQKNVSLSQAINRDLLAIIITADVLKKINENEFFTFLLEKTLNTPLLIMNVTFQINPKILENWSNGAVVGSKISGEGPTGLYKVENVPDIARQLVNQSTPFKAEGLQSLILGEQSKSLAIIQVKYQSVWRPLLLRTIVRGREVYFQTQMPYFSQAGSKWQACGKFLQLAPLVMFLKYSSKERGWHSQGHFANLTIDDPFLAEPQGHLSYKLLLEEMRKTNFHTTIAFIPRNFDRNKPEVVSLFKENPERFSICLHGNNHSPYEFYKYAAAPGDPYPAKSLHEQETNIVQALARMGKFQKLTGLPYDRIMVFPWGIAPSPTLGLLKKYNFLATCNGVSVPLDAAAPDDPLFNLRPVTLHFANFPSLKRYHSRGRTQFDLAADLFLDNPILFYEHEDFFAKGSNKFNETAELLNNLQPDLLWRRLGYIIQHLYLEKSRDDGNYDIKAFGGDIILTNQHGDDAIFFVKKEETFITPIKNITVDGSIYPYKTSKDEINIEIPVKAKQSRHIVILYENNLDALMANSANITIFIIVIFLSLVLVMAIAVIIIYKKWGRNRQIESHRV